MRSTAAEDTFAWFGGSKGYLALLVVSLLTVVAVYFVFGLGEAAVELLVASIPTVVLLAVFLRNLVVAPRRIHEQSLQFIAQIERERDEVIIRPHEEMPRGERERLEREERLQSRREELQRRVETGGLTDRMLAIHVAPNDRAASGDLCDAGRRGIENELAVYLKDVVAACKVLVESLFPDGFLGVVANDIDDETIPVLRGSFGRLEVDELRRTDRGCSDSRESLARKARFLEQLVSKLETGTATLAPEFTMPEVPTGTFLRRALRRSTEAQMLFGKLNTLDEDEPLSLELGDEAEALLSRIYLDFDTFGLTWEFDGLDLVWLMSMNSETLWEKYPTHKQVGARNAKANHVLLAANGLEKCLRENNAW